MSKSNVELMSKDENPISDGIKFYNRSKSFCKKYPTNCAKTEAKDICQTEYSSPSQIESCKNSVQITFWKDQNK